MEDVQSKVGFGQTQISLLSKVRAALGPLLPIIALLAIALAFHFLSGETFLTARNLSNLARQVGTNLILATGMTLVILTAGIDLSVGSVLALSGMVAAISQVQWGWASLGFLGALMSGLMAMSTGLVAGGLTGYAVSRLKITPFIVTLAMMVICRGLTLIFSGAKAVAPIGTSLGTLSSGYLPPVPTAIVFLLAGTWILFLQRNTWKKGVQVVWRQMGLPLVCLAVLAFVFCSYRGVPYMFLIAIGVALLAMGALRYQRFGRFLYAIGGNREAAELSGVPVQRTLWTTYLIMGALAGLAGLVDVSRVNAAVPAAGELAELDAIAAVVIGGTSLMGGIGGVQGTLLGVLIMGMLNNGMSLMGVSEHYQKVFKGVVILLAVYLDRRAKRA